MIKHFYSKQLPAQPLPGPEEMASRVLPCPVCHAKPGDPCRSTYDNNIRCWVHAEREDAPKAT